MRIFLICFCLLFARQASGFERCYLEATSKNTSSCFLASWNSTYSCDAPTNEGNVNCKTNSAEQADCIVKEVTLRGPKEIWCNGPPLKPDENAQITFMQSGERRRLTAERAGGNVSVNNLPIHASAENCDSYLTVGQNSWDFNRQYGLKVRCLKRRAAIEGVIPKENCDALLTAPGGTFSAYFDENRRQACLDRQAGVQPQPSTTRVCTTFGSTTTCR